MAKLTGRRQGLDQKKLAALEKVLKQAGITGQREILSGLRDHDEVIRVYNRDIKRYGLKSYLDKLPPSSRKAINERILRAEYKGKGKPIIPKYLPYNEKTKKGGYDLDGLKRQLKKDGLSDKDIDKVVVGVQRFRAENAGFGSSHLQGKKVDIPRYLLVKPEIIKLFVDKGYKILDEEGKGIWDIAFPVPGQKGSYKKVSGKRKPSSSKPGFKKAFDEAREMGQKEFKFDGKRFSTRMRGESVEEFEEKFKFVDDQKFDSPEEFERFRDQDIAIEQKKIIQEAKKPEQEIKAEDIQLEETIPMDQSVPFGVYAQGSNEFEMAEEQEKDKLMMAAEGGEVRYQEGGEVYDVPEYLRRPEEDIEEEDFQIEQVVQEPEPEPDLSGPEFDRDQYLLEQKSTQELMDTSVPGVGRPSAVNRELSRRKRQAESGFAEGQKTPTLREMAVEEKEEVVDVKMPKPEPEPKPARLSKTDFLDIRKLRDEKELRKAEDDAIKQAQQLSTIDPKRFYKNMSTFNKIVSLVGLAAGAYGSYKYGTPNAFIQRLDREVEKDIKAQALEANLEKRKLAAANFKVSVLAKRLARSTKDVEKQQEFLKLSRTYQQKGLKEIKKEVKKRKDIRDLSELNKRGVSDEELAYITVNFPKLKIEDSVIKGRDGLNYRVKGGVSRANKVKEYVSDAQDSLDGLNELLTYVDKVTIFEQGALNPFAAILSEDRAKADSLRDRLVGKLRIEFFGPGVMTDQERAQAKKILGDPNAFFTTDVREKAKIRSLIMKLNYGVRNKLRADGVPLPASPNDLRIKQMLGRRRLSDNAANRVKVIDGLIQSETDSIENGNPSGQFWDINEPLPL
tara:strand:- start:696 stop:3230 length:2535 start_codon:yes stop_codon:yes gene_type:complete